MGRRRLQILSIALGLMLVLIAGSYVLLTRHGYNALKLRSEGVDVAQLSREAGVKKKLGGRLSAEMDIEGNGRTISGLMKKAEVRGKAVE
jgi:hypothetical protein